MQGLSFGKGFMIPNTPSYTLADGATMKVTDERNVPMVGR